MTEYRERTRARAVAAGVSASPFVGHNVVQSNQAPSLDSLMWDYGLTNEMDITACENPNEQTIEQEFQFFVMAPLSPKGTSSPKFWEVCEAQKEREIIWPFRETVQQIYASDTFRNIPQLPSYPSLCGSFRVCVLIQCQNRHKEAQLHQPNVDGGPPDAQICSKEGLSRFY
jgi:hypothetical protein